MYEVYKVKDVRGVHNVGSLFGQIPFFYSFNLPHCGHVSVTNYELEETILTHTITAAMV